MKIISAIKKQFFKCILSYIAPKLTPQIPGVLHSNWVFYFNHHPIWKQVIWKLKRDVYLAIHQQKISKEAGSLCRAKRVLWVYLGSNQIGDSIMDLSPRTLFANTTIEVDLFTNDYISSLYIGDSIFSHIFSKPNLVNFNHYDIVILNSLSWKCIKFKTRYLPKTKFVSLLGYYYGPEYNRIEFNYNALSYYLNTHSKVSELDHKSIFNLSLDHNPLKQDKSKIAIAIGGVQGYRLYAHWCEFVAELTNLHPNLEIVLIGSENGISTANEIMKKNANNANITNLVGKQSINEVFLLLKSVAMLICADGGLLHLGKVAQTKILALFAGDIHPLMRFNNTDRASVIHCANNVSDINPKEIIKVFSIYLNSKSQKLEYCFLDKEPPCTTNQSISSLQ